jgi:hypothetical protein
MLIAGQHSGSEKVPPTSFRPYRPCSGVLSVISWAGNLAGYPSPVSSDVPHHVANPIHRIGTSLRRYTRVTTLKANFSGIRFIHLRLLRKKPF